jgi:hypothetical protein
MSSKPWSLFHVGPYIRQDTDGRERSRAKSKVPRHRTPNLCLRHCCRAIRLTALTVTQQHIHSLLSQSVVGSSYPTLLFPPLLDRIPSSAFLRLLRCMHSSIPYPVRPQEVTSSNSMLASPVVCCLLLSLVLHLLLATAPSVSADYVISSLDKKDYGWEGTLKLASPAPYGDDIHALKLSVWFETDTRLRVTLRDADKPRWEIPADFLHIDSRTPPTSAPTAALYDFSVTSTPFGFAITRRSTGVVLFNTTMQSLYYSSLYLQVGTAMLADANVYGLGERIMPFRLPQEDFVIYTQGQRQ